MFELPLTSFFTFFKLFDSISGTRSPPEHFGANRITKFSTVP